MKRLLCLLVLICFMSGCAGELAGNGRIYKSYGLINQNDKRCPEVEYEPCWGNIIWGCILFESIIGPIYFFGFSMFEPVRIKTKEAQNG